METAGSSVVSVDLYHVARCRIPDDGNVHSHSREDTKSGVVGCYPEFRKSIYSTLKKEVVCAFETSVPTNQVRRSYNPEDGRIYLYLLSDQIYVRSYPVVPQRAVYGASCCRNVNRTESSILCHISRSLSSVCLPSHIKNGLLTADTRGVQNRRPCSRWKLSCAQRHTVTSRTVTGN